MRQLLVRPPIYMYESAIDFVNDFCIGPDDLLLSSQAVFMPHFGELLADVATIFVEDCGNGDKDFATAEALRARIAGIGAQSRLIAIGNDTVLNLAKIASLDDSIPLKNLFAGKCAALRIRELVLAPSSCDSGSEVTGIATLKSPETGDIPFLKSDSLSADAAVLIPQLLEGLPFRAFVAGAAEALIRAAESYVSPVSSSHIRLFAKAAIQKILRGFRDIAVNGEMARIPLLSDFLIASNYAGISIGNAGGGAVQALATPIVARLGVAHGEAGSLFFNAVFERYRSIRDTAELNCLETVFADALGCEAKNAYAEATSLLERVLPLKMLSEYGVTERDLDRYTIDVMTRQGRFMANCPVLLEEKDIRSIYNRLFRRISTPIRRRMTTISARSRFF
jgi:4-hydroxybutyrate dehydrogenase